MITKKEHDKTIEIAKEYTIGKMYLIGSPPHKKPGANLLLISILESPAKIVLP